MTTECARYGNDRCIWGGGEGRLLSCRCGGPLRPARPWIVQAIEANTARMDRYRAAWREGATR